MHSVLLLQGAFGAATVLYIFYWTLMITALALRSINPLLSNIEEPKA